MSRAAAAAQPTRLHISASSSRLDRRCTVIPLLQALLDPRLYRLCSTLAPLQVLPEHLVMMTDASAQLIEIIL